MQDLQHGDQKRRMRRFAASHPENARARRNRMVLCHLTRKVRRLKRQGKRNMEKKGRFCVLCKRKKGNDKGSNQITAEERQVIGSPEEPVGYVQYLEKSECIGFHRRFLWSTLASP